MPLSLMIFSFLNLRLIISYIFAKRIIPYYGDCCKKNSRLNQS